MVSSRALPLVTYSSTCVGKLLIDALQKPFGLLVPCCVFSAANTGMAEVPHEDQSLGTRAFFQLSEDPHYNITHVGLPAHLTLWVCL